MPYEVMANSVTPQLVIYLLDVSASMKKELGGGTRIEAVSDALTAALRQMVFRSTKGGRLSPRYHVGIYAYSDKVWDLLDGIQPIDKVAALGVPELGTMRTTDTAKAFAVAEQLLQANLDRYHACPAPLVCHMTDGQYTTADPEPGATRIKGMSVADGNVLVENIYISDDVLGQPVEDPSTWPGISPDTELASAYAAKLAAMSSPLPDSYRVEMLEIGYHMQPGALMMLPGTSPELVAMGFQMTTATRVQ